MLILFYFEFAINIKIIFFIENILSGTEIKIKNGIIIAEIKIFIFDAKSFEKYKRYIGVYIKKNNMFVLDFNKKSKDEKS